MLQNEENKIKNIKKGIEKFTLRFMKRCKMLKTKLDELLLLY